MSCESRVRGRGVMRIIFSAVVSFGIIAMLAVNKTVLADQVSTGSGGIVSQSLGLSGEGVAIGQVGRLRPGFLGFDRAELTHPDVAIQDGFVWNSPSPINTAVGEVPTQAAGVMISKNSENPGIAPNALLFASAYVTLGENPGYQHALLATQEIARQDDESVAAILHGWGKATLPGALRDGDSLVTLGIDWISTEFDLLQVIAGNELVGGFPLPTDGYNGLVIASTAATDGIFNRVDSRNFFTEDAFGPRTTVSMVAPGIGINAPILNGNSKDGSSSTLAAAHVTGGVALLQEFANRQLTSSNPGWTTDALRHQVMKAVLMNSADKLLDNRGGVLLGMEKTIETTDRKTWLDSPAFIDQSVPLDKELGTGQLNMARAVRQFRAAEQEASDILGVPRVGWDWNSLDGAGQIRRYIIDEPLVANSFISATLTWDRAVELIDDNENDLYDDDEFFQELGLTNLDLYLMPSGATDLSQSIWSSVSEESSVEHIFFRLPSDGAYELWVNQADAPLGAQDYALAWWGVGGEDITQILPGDTNGDGAVDLADFSAIKNAFGIGSSLQEGDFNGDGVVDLADFALIKQNFGSAAPDPSSNPDPALPGDTNGDGAVDLADFSAIKNAFGIGSSLQEGDFNGDGVVDLADFALIKQNFGSAASVGVPEPPSLLLAVGAALGAAGLINLRYRRY